MWYLITLPVGTKWGLFWDKMGQNGGGPKWPVGTKWRSGAGPGALLWGPGGGGDAGAPRLARPRAYNCHWRRGVGGGQCLQTRSGFPFVERPRRSDPARSAASARKGVGDTERDAQRSEVAGTAPDKRLGCRSDAATRKRRARRSDGKRERRGKAEPTRPSAPAIRPESIRGQSRGAWDPPCSSLLPAEQLAQTEAKPAHPVRGRRHPDDHRDDRRAAASTGSEGGQPDDGLRGRPATSAAPPRRVPGPSPGAPVVDFQLRSLIAQ